MTDSAPGPALGSETLTDSLPVGATLPRRPREQRWSAAEVHLFDHTSGLNILLTESLQVVRDSGAKRALIPIENKRNFLDVSADIMEHVDPIFFGDPKTAAMNVLGG